jgi:hypothetical protein
LSLIQVTVACAAAPLRSRAMTVNVSDSALTRGMGV